MTDLPPVTDEELDLIEATCVGITKRTIEADIESYLGTTIGAVADGPEVVGIPVPVARRLVAELLRLRAAYAATQRGER